MIRQLAVCALVGAISHCALYSETSAAESGKVFRAGAHEMDISPPFGPLLVNGGFTQRSVQGMPKGSLHARCLVLDDGATRIAFAIVDSCMIPRDVCDRVKELAAKATGLPTERILISATHTHSAPSVMDYCLGTSADRRYTEFLPAKVAEGIRLAHERLAPAHVGWTVADARGYTHCRRWILRPDRIGRDPFGQQNVRAMMHPGYQNPSYIGPAGPVDTALSILAVRTPDGEPISVLANFSMHYLGGGPADYFGPFAHSLAKKLKKGESSPVCMMSQGTSGDLHWMDYSRPRRHVGPYAEQLATIAHKAYEGIEFHDWAPLAMDERILTLDRRRSTPERLKWARDVLKEMKGRRPRNQREVYAEQADFIEKNPTVEIKLQALRIGELGITAIPNEVYGITGLKLKLQSPLQPTFNIELANGAAGYIPPPSQHRLGGYTTWPARTAGLEVGAEPKITETLLSSLEKISGKQRRPMPNTGGPYVKSLLAAKPRALWRMEEIQGFDATDSTGNRHQGKFQGGVAFFLDGPQSTTFSHPHPNRAVHFAGGHLRASLKSLSPEYSVSFWFWNGLPAAARPVTGALFTRGEGDAQESLIIGGNVDHQSAGKLNFRIGKKMMISRASVQDRSWHNVVMVRAKDRVKVYLDGSPQAEIDASITPCEASGKVFVAGGTGESESFAGKIDEVAIFDRLLSEEEATRLYQTSKMKPPPRPKLAQIFKSKAADEKSLADLGKTILGSKPRAYWRLHDKDRKAAKDASANQLDAAYEDGAEPFKPAEVASNFTGGRVRAKVEALSDTYSIEFWFWNETNSHARPITGYLFSRGADGSTEAIGDHLGIGGTHAATGKLLVFNGNERNQILTGQTQLTPQSWNHVVMVRRKNEVCVYLNGNTEPEIKGELPITFDKRDGQLFIGGRCDNFANLIGRIDEVAVFDRALTPDEIAAHFKAGGA